MDDIKAASIRRFERALKESNWEMALDTRPANSVPVWIYSASLNEGVRVIGQLSLDAYRESKVPGRMPSVPGLSAWDALIMAYREFDALKTDEERHEKQAALSAALLSYASITKTWQLLPGLDSVRGIHFVVFDWQTSAGLRILKPGFATGHEVLSKEHIGELFSILLGMHLASYPHEAPVLCE
ncbi:hypothetical protein ACRCPS_17530 [Pseudomonas aeruginosa]